MSESLTLELPHLPPTLNRWSRAHWSVRAKWAREWRGIVAAYAPRKPRPYFVRPVTVEFTFSSPRPVDADSLPKFALDGCCGVLFPDDSRRWLVEIRLRSVKGPPSTRIRVWAEAEE